MSSKRERVFVLTGLIVFIISTCSFSALVIWTMTKGNDSKDTTSSNTNKEKKVDQKDKLEGTKLKDFGPVSDVKELKITDLQEGKGSVVKAGDTVTVDYTGAVAATGVIFQSSIDSGQPVTFSLDQVIDGWKEGMVGMKIGGKRRLIIPADKAYGANPPQNSGIPANAPLVFDVTLYSIGQ
ncbi:MAG TPA: FKBP-type peptidyl-prolyl cis-trans isomerase [Candidatus Saccharimonadales bacterium]|nr:FKBP-type peptidyl-prolyl cis-trans isomerase [Candidatus Saccharimonadales bacterium]